MDSKQTNRNQWFHPDVPKAVRNHLLGEHHTMKHKCIFGTFIALLGVGMVQIISPMVQLHVVHIIIDYVGYGLHGVGILPFVKIIEGGAK